MPSSFLSKHQLSSKLTEAIVRDAATRMEDAGLLGSKEMPGYVMDGQSNFFLSEVTLLRMSMSSHLFPPISNPFSDWPSAV